MSLETEVDFPADTVLLKGGVEHKVLILVGQLEILDFFEIDSGTGVGGIDFFSGRGAQIDIELSSSLFGEDKSKTHLFADAEEGHIGYLRLAA